MIGRRLTVCLAVIAAVLGLSTAHADEPVRIVAQDKTRGLELRLVAGAFGRILDVNTTDSAPEQTDVTFFVDGNDVTPSVVSRPPLIEIAYVFSGINASRQCSFKVQLDAALDPISAFNLAYSDVENTLCSEFGIRPLQAWHEDFIAPRDYSRLLVIDVSEEGTGGAPVDRANIWAQLAVPAALFDDKPRLVSEVTGFIDANIFGGWSIIPTDIAPAEASLTIAFADADGVFFTLSDGPSAAPSVFAQAERLLLFAVSHNFWLIVLVLVFLGIAIVIVVARRPARRSDAVSVPEDIEPLRAVAVGYGSDRRYSLGEGAERDVALVMIYPDGQMRLVRKSETDAILVNGTPIEQDAWITAADRVIIGAKQFQFT